MSFSALGVAYRALSAQQHAIHILNHNIANANTPGYSRQRVNMQALPPYLVPAGSGWVAHRQVGSGVDIKSVDRVRELFLDLQIQNARWELGSMQVRKESLDKLQIIYNEPSDTGLNNLLSRYWESWHDLNSNPADLSNRAAVVQQGAALAQTLNRNYRQIELMQNDLRGQANLTVGDVNEIAEKLARLNVQIQRAQQGGDMPNDLLDQRDMLLDDLAGLVRFNVSYREDGTVSVFVSDQELVASSRHRTMEAGADADGNVTIQWSDTGQAVDPRGGRLGGILESANSLIPAKLAELDALAAQLRDDVNALHVTGFDLNGDPGLEFFVGAGARDITVNGALEQNTALLAAAGQPGAAGDGSVALAIAQLQHISAQVDAASDLSTGDTLASSGVTIQRLTVPGATPGQTYTFSSAAPGEITLSATINGVVVSQTLPVGEMTGSADQVLDFSSLGIRLALRGTGPDATAANIIADLISPGSDSITIAPRTSVDQAYQQSIAALGVEARSTDAGVANEKALLSNLEQRRESISGVSLDEEAANLIKYQRAYQAAARLVTVVDEMMDTIIRSMGITGRF